MLSTYMHGVNAVIEKLLRWCINPRLRARLLAILGAQIGKNVRVHEIQLFNLRHGFRNLHLDDDVYVGPGCRLDLEGTLKVGPRTSLSAGVTILTHHDPGSSHGAPLTLLYPPRVATTTIGADCWIGANAILLDGITINNFAVIAAGSVVITNVIGGCLVAGNPAQIKKNLKKPSSLDQ